MTSAPDSGSCSDSDSCLKADSNFEAARSKVIAKTEADSSREIITRMVRLEDAAKCHGIDLLWLVLSAVVMDRSQSVAAIVEPPLLFCFMLCDELSISVDDCPDPPVP